MDRKLKDLWNKKKIALKYLRYDEARKISEDIIKLLEVRKKCVLR